MKKNLTGMFAFLATAAGPALAGQSIGNGGSGIFGFFIGVMQEWTDFLSGPYATAALITVIILGFAAWAALPKEGVMSNIVRYVVAGFAILNTGVWLTALKIGN